VEHFAGGIGHQPSVALAVGTKPVNLRPAGLGDPIQLTHQIDEHSFNGLDTPYVATPALLRRFGVDPSSVDPRADVLTSDRSTDLALLDDSQRGDGTTTRVQHVRLPAYTSGPYSLIPPAAVARHGWTTVPSGWLVEARHPLSGAQIRAARHAAATVGLDMEVRDQQDSLAAVRRIATGVGAALALAIVAMTIGLLRGEAATEVRTLTATGARTRTLRAITAWSAGALTVASVVLSLVGSYAALAAAFHSQLDRLVPLPLAPLLVVALGLPLTAAVGGWLLAGRDPRSVARAVLD
jgi:putative ABC transport system permease protein